jgi:hypothetical protein
MAGKGQAAFNYAGLAALITAVTAAISLFWGGGEAEKVQDSAFAVLQYRVQNLERYCLPPPVSTVEAPGAPSAAVRDAYEEEAAVEMDLVLSAPQPLSGEVVVVEVDEAPTVISAVKDKILKKIRSREAVSLDDIRQHVQESGQALTDEDF